jgi:hypothetical protein
MSRTRLAPILVLSVVGCGAPNTPTHGRIDDGFLSTYAHLHADPTRPDLFVWRLEGADLAAYRSVIVEMPALRRRPDDQLPSPEIRAGLSDAMRDWLLESLTPRLQRVQDVGDAQVGETLVVKTAITTALRDRGLEPPIATHHGWGEVPMRFAFECEVLDAVNRRPLARMVSFDRTQWIPARSLTPWPACERDFAAWGRDAAWLIQPPAPVPAEPWAPPVPESAPAPEPVPVST